MAKSVSGAIIDQIIKSGVAVWFKSAGFKRKGRFFTRECGEFIQTANVQAFSVNMPDNATFAVNLGVEWPHWHQLWTGSINQGNVAIAPTFSVRLHPNLFPTYDHWWPANSATDVGNVATEITLALTKFAEKFWEHYVSLDKVLEDFEAKRKVPALPQPLLVHAAILCKFGRVDEARPILLEAARKAPNNGALAKMVAHRLGLNVFDTE